MIVDRLKALLKLRDHVGALALVGDLLDHVEVLPEAERELALQYREGDDRDRRYLVDGILEHLFENDSARRLFEGWSVDPILRTAYEEAAEWAKALLGKRRFLSRIAHKCVQQMRSRGIEDAVVKTGGIGIDSVELTWREGEENVHLILDCTYECIAGTETDAAVEEGLAQFAMEPSHWITDEDAPWQRLVMLG